MRQSKGLTTYRAHVVAGLEGVATEELRDRFPGVEIVDAIEKVDERTGLIIFRASVSPEDLLGLRAVEDVFLLTVDTTLPSGRAALTAVRSTISVSRVWDRALEQAWRVRHARGKPTFRVVSRLAGRQPFRRVDLQRAVERALLDRLPAWRLVNDNAQVEIWASLIGPRLLLGIRLSDATMRHRTYLRETLPAALKPTIAAAMVWLSEPRNDDVFLEPMAGSGTILIERAEAARYRQLLAGDRDAAAVRAIRRNIGPRYQPVQVSQLDARYLPVESGSISAIVTNLPFGEQIGTHAGHRQLYPELLKEWSRVLHPAGRMVLLTSERVLLRDCLRRHPELTRKHTVPVLVRGIPAAIYVLRKSA